jgi:RimJ/RimL family protein N-acetyltransferase
VREWRRVIFTLDRPAAVAAVAAPPGGDHRIRRLRPDDAEQLDRLGDGTRWISATWGGPAGMAASGAGWGAFAGERLVAVACPFFVGSVYEDLGVVTEPDARGLGLSTACAAAVVGDVHARGRIPSWTTSPDNAASLRIAAKLGFALRRHDRLLVVGVEIP